MNHSWTFNWVTEWEQIWSQAFQEKWLRLYKESHLTNAFFHPAHARAWVEYRNRNAHVVPRFLIGTTERGSEAMFPLICPDLSWKDCFLKRLLPLGEFDFDFNDPLVKIGDEDPKEVYKLLFQDLEATLRATGPHIWDSVELPHLRRGEFPDTQIGIEEISPRAQLSNFRDYEAYVLSLKKKHRYDIRSKMEQLKELGPLRLEICEPHQTEKGLLWVSELLKAHKMKYSSSDTSLDYLELVVSNCLETGVLHLSRLTVNDQAIAWHLGLLDSECLHWYLPSYNESFSRFSPGKVHVAMCIQWCFENGVSSIDFLRGDELYKSRWTEEVVLLRRVKIRNNHPISFFRRGVAKVLTELKRDPKMTKD